MKNGQRNAQYAHRTKADLHNWLPHEVKYEKKIKHSGRIVDGDEYERLVLALLNPQRLTKVHFRAFACIESLRLRRPRDNALRRHIPFKIIKTQI